MAEGFCSLNDSGSVVGYSDAGAWIWDAADGTQLLNSLIVSSGWTISDAVCTQGSYNGGPAEYVELTPQTALSVVNPFADYAIPDPEQAPPTLVVSAVQYAPPATSLAADGQSAVVLVYHSQSSQQVTFALAAGGTGLEPTAGIGSLGPFDPNYLANPSPPGGSVQSYTVATPTYGPDAAGNYWFLALLWSPGAMPAPSLSLAELAVTAAQQGQSAPSLASLLLEPPPLLLIHGIWSSPAGAGFTPGSGGFYDWISGQYPHNQIFPVDYCAENSKEFNDPVTQQTLLASMGNALASAAAAGMAARTVDVVAHSMGGLVTRYFLSTAGYLGNPALLQNPVHKLITIGTPHLGTNLATTLVNNQAQVTVLALTADPVVQGLCLAFSSCTLGDLFSLLGKPIDTGAQSLEPGSPQLFALSSSNIFSAIVGSAPTSPISATESLLDVVIAAFLPGQTVASILNNQLNDTIVPIASQDPPGTYDTATVEGIVHTSVCGPCSMGETASPAVWQQAYWWLTGGTAYAPTEGLTASASPKTSESKAVSAATPPLPMLNLSGYAQVASSNVTFTPATGSTLTINSVSNITAASSTKTITEVLLLQTVMDPADTILLYSTQSPFSISFTPARLGTASFAAIAVFSDNTYAITTLNYTLQPSGSPYALNLLNVPVASMTVGSSQVVQAYALYTGGQINVTQAATYTAASGTANVFGVSSGGTITADGDGVDLLNVSYGGASATVQIPVGPCTYSLNPSNQIVPNTGGTVTIQVATQPGCAWTASGGAAWAPFSQASGSGNGAITLQAAANSSGGTQSALVTLAGLQAFVTQPSTACGYGLSQTQIDVPAAGASGTIAVTTSSSCPVIASSSQSWVTAVLGGGSSVLYTVAPNNGTSQRSATLTIGSVGIPVTQAAAVNQNGSGDRLARAGSDHLWRSAFRNSVGCDGISSRFVRLQPASGTVLPVGAGQTLSVTFTPTDYTTATGSTTITVNPAAPPSSPVDLVVTKVLTRSNGNVVVQFTIANTGGTAAANVVLTSVKVGSDSATPIPQTIGTIAAGAFAPATVTVPGSVGASGDASSLALSGTYAGGTFSSSARITLP